MIDGEPKIEFLDVTEAGMRFRWVSWPERWRDAGDGLADLGEWTLRSACTPDVDDDYHLLYAPGHDPEDDADPYTWPASEPLDALKGLIAEAAKKWRAEERERELVEMRKAAWAAWVAREEDAEAEFKRRKLAEMRDDLWKAEIQDERVRADSIKPGERYKHDCNLSDEVFRMVRVLSCLTPATFVPEGAQFGVDERWAVRFTRGDDMVYRVPEETK